VARSWYSFLLGTDIRRFGFVSFRRTQDWSGMMRRLQSVALTLLMLVSVSAAGCSIGEEPSTTVSSLPSTTKSASSTTTIAPTSTVPAPSSTLTTGPPTTAKPSTTTTKTSPGTTTTAKPAKDYTIIPTDEKVVALTFDAAYDPAPLEKILSALDTYDAEATFFLTGEFVRDFPQWTKRIVSGGYPIGNHSYSHPDFTTLSDSAMRNELRKTANALEEIGANDPRPLFRAPYGALNKRVLSVVGAEGYVSVFWTIDTLDWKPERTTAQIKTAVLQKLKPGAIILMHVGSKQTGEILPELLAEIQARGYRFVNLRDALPEG